MTRLVFASCVALCLAHPVYGQSPEEQVTKTNEQILVAAQKRDIAAYTKLTGDDLRWIQADGSVITKARRLSDLKTTPPATANSRTFTDTDVKVYGNTAVLVCRSDYDRDGKRMAERVHRVFVNRNGSWVLVSHSATPLANSGNR